MTPEAIIANAEDLARIERLTWEGRFAPWFPTYSRQRATAYMIRIMTLRIRYAFKPYPGPVVTES